MHDLDHDEKTVLRLALSRLALHYQEERDNTEQDYLQDHCDERIATISRLLDKLN